EKSWLIFADQEGIGCSLAERLRAAGIRCRTAFRGTAFVASEPDTFTLRAETPEDWRQLLAACAGEAAPERILYLWNLDARIDEDAAIGTGALLHLAQSLDRAWPTSKVRIDSVTRGAQAVGRDGSPTLIAQAPAVGMMRVILNEYPNYACRGIDLPSASSPADVNLLWVELLRAESEREVAFRGEARYVQRLE